MVCLGDIRVNTPYNGDKDNNNNNNSGGQLQVSSSQFSLQFQTLINDDIPANTEPKASRQPTSTRTAAGLLVHRTTPTSTNEYHRN